MKWFVLLAAPVIVLVMLDQNFWFIDIRMIVKMPGIRQKTLKIIGDDVWASWMIRP